MSLELEGIQSAQVSARENEETEERSITALPPSDEGIQAWKFLLGCFIVEAIFWGKSDRLRLSNSIWSWVQDSQLVMESSKNSILDSLSSKIILIYLLSARSGRVFISLAPRSLPLWWESTTRGSEQWLLSDGAYVSYPSWAPPSPTQLGRSSLRKGSCTAQASLSCTHRYLVCSTNGSSGAEVSRMGSCLPAAASAALAFLFC
jgi:hypothetical protein